MSGWELMGRLKSGFRFFHLMVFLALPPAGQKHHNDGMGPRVAYKLLQDRSVCPLLLSGDQYSAQHSECSLDMFAE